MVRFICGKVLKSENVLRAVIIFPNLIRSNLFIQFNNCKNIKIGMALFSLQDLRTRGRCSENVYMTHISSLVSKSLKKRWVPPKTTKMKEKVEQITKSPLIIEIDMRCS